MTVKDDRVDEAKIRELLDAWVQALRSRDADAIVSRQAPDVVSFDVVNPLQYVGSGETRRRAQEWLSSFQGPVGLKMRELSVTVGEDVAFAHSLNRVSGRTADSQAIAMWLPRPCASARSTASGPSPISTARCRSMGRAAGLRSISSPDARLTRPRTHWPANTSPAISAAASSCIAGMACE